MILPRIVRNYFRPEKLKEEYFELNGKIEGPYKSYDIEGNLTTFCYYIDGKKNGICYDYIGGNPVSITYFVNDNLEGESIGYFNNGSISSITNYKNNRKHGPSITYYSNGNIKSTCIYTNHRQSGEYTFYYQDGTIKDYFDYRNYNWN